MEDNRVDPNLDEEDLNPEAVMRAVSGRTYRAESIVAALRHAGIPFNRTTLAALGLVQDAIIDEIEAQEL